MADLSLLISELSTLQIILTGLIVGNVAAITLSVSGLTSMHQLASKVYSKNNPIIVRNRYIPHTIPFRVLESTYLMVFCFIVSEIAALTFLFGEVFGDLGNNPTFATNLIFVGIIAFTTGIVITLIMYSLLFWHSFQKIQVRQVTDNSRQYKTVESIFSNP